MKKIEENRKDKFISFRVSAEEAIIADRIKKITGVPISFLLRKHFLILIKKFLKK